MRGPEGSNLSGLILGTDWRGFRKKWGTPWRPPQSLLLVDEMAAAILLPTSFVAFGAERFFFAVADRLDAAGADAKRGQSGLNRARALIAQRQVVLGGTALVAVSFNREIHVRMLSEELRIGLYRRLLVSANVGLIVVKIDVLHVLIEQVLIGHIRGGRRRRRRLRHRQTRRRFLRTARAFGDQVISGRIARRNALRSIRLHRANAVNRNIGRVAGLPCQRGGPASLNRVRIHRN